MNNKIEKMFGEMIKEYGMQLHSTNKTVFLKVLKQLKEEEFSNEEIYWLFWNLGDRNIIDNSNLFNYDLFRKEALSIANCARNQENNYQPKEMVSILTGEIIEIGEDDLDSYIKYYLKPTLSITKLDWYENKKSLIDQLSKADIYIDFNLIPNHPYIDEKVLAEIKEEQRKNDIDKKAEIMAEKIKGNMENVEIITIPVPMKKTNPIREMLEQEMSNNKELLAHPEKIYE